MNKVIIIAFLATFAIAAEAKFEKESRNKKNSKIYALSIYFFKIF